MPKPSSPLTTSQISNCQSSVPQYRGTRGKRMESEADVGNLSRIWDDMGSVSNIFCRQNCHFGKWPSDESTAFWLQLLFFKCQWVDLLFLTCFFFPIFFSELATVLANESRSTTKHKKICWNFLDFKPITLQPSLQSSLLGAKVQISSDVASTPRFHK